MDVVCGRCRAEYEFDDALISERGTTVRCTNCGLQFKVFPPVGQTAPELWTVYDPANPEAPLAEFDSLGALQRAIAARKVTARHLLARGRQGPRPLKEIVELQPLLAQTESDLAELQILHPNLATEGTQPRSGTVLGIAQRPDPAGRRAQPPPRFEDAFAAEDESWAEQPDDQSSVNVDLDSQAVVPAAPDLTEDPAEQAQRSARSDEVDPETAVVPSEPPDPLEDAEAPLGYQRPESVRPRIRSALSFGALEDEPPASVHSQRPPLSRTLSGGLSPQAPRSPSMAAPRADVPSASSGRLSWESRGAVSPAPQVEARRRPSSVPPPGSVPPPAITPSSVPPPGSVPPPAITPSSVRRPSSVPHSMAPGSMLSSSELSSRGSIGGQLTPTPLGMRAVTSVDSEVVTPIAEGPARRRATGLVLIVSVVLGGAGVAAWNQRERLASGVASSDGVAAGPVELDSSLRRAVQAADVAWWKARIDSDASGPDRAGLEALVDQVEAAGGELTWTMVSLQRMLGNLASARRLAGSLPRGEGAAYAMATIDLSEEGEPPWPLVLERFKEASTGERAPFLARIGRIFSLLESGDAGRARAEFEAWGRLSGARESALFAPLKERLRRAGFVLDREGRFAPPSAPPEGATQRATSSRQGEGARSRDDAAQGTASQSENDGTRREATTANPPEAPESARPATSSPKQPAEKEPSTSEGEPSLPPVSEALQQKVAEADALWRSGERDGAVALYRQVVDEIGTSHFLGQRSAARVALAEREKAAAEQRSANETPE